MSSDEADAFATIAAYIDALNRNDTDGVRAAFSFPHVLFAQGRVFHYPTAESFSLADFKQRVSSDGWVRSSIDGSNVVFQARTRCISISGSRAGAPMVQPLAFITRFTSS